MTWPAFRLPIASISPPLRSSNPRIIHGRGVLRRFIALIDLSGLSGRDLWTLQTHNASAGAADLGYEPKRQDVADNKQGRSFCPTVLVQRGEVKAVNKVLKTPVSKRTS